MEEVLADGYILVITSADPPVVVVLVLIIKKSVSESVTVLNFNTAADKLQIHKERACEGMRRICMSYVAIVTTSWFLSKISKGCYSNRLSTLGGLNSSEDPFHLQVSE